MTYHTYSAGSLNLNPCGCPDWHGCIMRSTVSGEDGIQPYKFSACSVDHFQRWMDQGSALCLLNKPRKFCVFFQRTMVEVVVT